MLYVEDLSVGQQFKSREYEMTLAEVIKFADLFDPQSFHTTPDVAQEHPIFQGLAASGWHTSAVCMRLWTECMPIAQGLVGVDSHVHWTRPTRVGDRIHVEVRIEAIRVLNSKPDRAIVSYHTQALNQHGVVLMRSDTNIVVFKRASVQTLA